MIGTLTMPRPTGKRGQAGNPQSDSRFKDYIPSTPFQAWAKPLLEANRKSGKGPADYTELLEILLARKIDVSDSTLYKAIRGNPARRPGYELALAVGEVLGDVKGALLSAEYPIPNINNEPENKNQSELKRNIDPRAMEALDAFEGLPETLQDAGLEYLKSLDRIAKKNYRKRTDIIGKLPDDEDDPGIERIADFE